MDEYLFQSIFKREKKTKTETSVAQADSSD